QVFLKTHGTAPPGFFLAEATGLEEIATTNTLDTPTVHRVSDHFLLMDYIPAVGRGSDYWEVLGHQLYRMHNDNKARQHNTEFGFTDNFCGLTPQINTPMADGYEFFTTFRLQTQAKRAFDSQKLAEADLQRIDAICNALPDLIPDQPPALVHGDLWSGNVIVNSSGQPTLIDPACYYGWAESDLAMTTLFGGFPDAFYRAYEQSGAVASDWRSRKDIYNLYHLLNHLNLFGSGYFTSVKDILKRFS
ncbi:MAG: fructosamine kinase family protein, partial [Pseudomonadales bacterium]|nr:fructosamine kinase family protein [Pseudomonadales bacterium]